MSTQLTAAQVWQTIEKELFAVVGMVNAANEARTAGLVYVVRDRKLYVATGRDTWKARHMAANPHVSVTIPIAKRVPIMPWLKIPQATITFQGTAQVFPAAEASPELLRAIFQHKADDREMVAGSCLVEITPVGEFVTYGVGVRLMDMREPEKARGRAPVG
jgi:nitroimidazol reductase NimA-like FMN-containing flavoprotein (pyridoxamine 5'-phosphate oxidase superfamily)